MANGRGWLGFAGFGEESAAATYATATAAAWYASILNEKIASNEGYFVPESIINSPFVDVDAPGRHTVQGNIALVPDAYTLGWPLKWANRTLANATAPAAVTGFTAVIGAGGSLPAGIYQYQVAPIWTLTGTNLHWMGNLVAEQSATSAGSPGNATTALNWTAAANPNANLYTLYGVAIFRSAVGGSTQFYLATVIGTATTYSDTGLTTLSTTAAPTTTITEHTYTGSNSGQKTFTTEVYLDANSKSKQIQGCKVNTLDLKMQAKGPITASIGIIGQQMNIISGTTPTFTALAPIMGQNCIAYFQAQGAAEAQLAQASDFTLKLDNKLEGIESMNASRTIRALRDGERVLSGSMTLQCETNTWLADVLNNPGTYSRMSYHLVSWAAPQDGGTCNFSPAAGVNVTYWPYMLEIILPNFSLNTGDVPLANRKQIIQTIQFARPLYDATTGSDCKISLYNGTSAYADVA